MIVWQTWTQDCWLEGGGDDVGGEDDYKNACPISSKSNAENKNDNKKNKMKIRMLVKEIKNGLVQFGII